VRSGRLRRLSGLDQTLTTQPGHLLVGVLRIPEDHASPVRVITRRMVIALAVLLAATFVVYLDRSGYRDVRGDRLTFLDCLYFAAVSLSTTGYGDITPYTEAARLVNTVVFTPLRIAFLAVLVGTTLEVLSERSRQAWKIQRWRSRVRNHTIVIGYGTKGKTAVGARLGDEAAQGEIVVVDTDRARARRDRRSGHRARRRHQIRCAAVGRSPARLVDHRRHQP
jgi:voltage-gated potassium channel